MAIALRGARVAGTRNWRMKPCQVVLAAVLATGCGGSVIDAAADAAGADMHDVNAEDGSDAFECPASPPAHAQSCEAAARCNYDCAPGRVEGVRATCDGRSWNVAKFSCGDATPIEVGSEGLAGTPCSTTSDCDPAATGGRSCSKEMFLNGPVNPTAVCITTRCDASITVGEYVACDKGAGICLRTSPTGGLCMGACFFGSTTAAPIGCAGKNACNAYAWSNTDGKVVGYGFCFAGCAADEDCPSGSFCQFETSQCVKSPVAYSLPQGAACTASDTTMGRCDCLHSISTGAGYCANHCRVGGPACSPGLVCDPMLPATLFSTLPSGLGGRCLKACTSDLECTGGARCRQSGGMTSKTCQVDERLP